MITIDLNCDMGESFGAYTIGADEAVMASISSANVACGYHGGDPARHAADRAAGAAMPASRSARIRASLTSSDSAGGRCASPPQDVEDMVLYQIGALAAIAQGEGMRLSHVKPHGALYNMAVRDRALADAIARAVAAFDPSLILFGLPGSELARAGQAAGPAGRARRICRSRVRAGRIADAAVAAGRSHPRRRRRSSTRAVRMAAEGSRDRVRRIRTRDARGHDLHARRHARRAGADAGASRGPRTGRYHGREPSRERRDERGTRLVARRNP